jgi:hypothetical protein
MKLRMVGLIVVGDMHAVCRLGGTGTSTGRGRAHAHALARPRGEDSPSDPDDVRPAMSEGGLVIGEEEGPDRGQGRGRDQDQGVILSAPVVRARGLSPDLDRVQRRIRLTQGTVGAGAVPGQSVVVEGVTVATIFGAAGRNPLCRYEREKSLQNGLAVCFLVTIFHCTAKCTTYCTLSSWQSKRRLQRGMVCELLSPVAN